MKVALAVLFLLRSLWVPAHLALEPHSHSVPGGGSDLQSESVDRGHVHRDGMGFHVHDHGLLRQTPDNDGRDERSPHAPHPATDHDVNPVVPQARVVLAAEPAALGTALEAIRDLELRWDPIRATASAPGGRSPPPRPPTRAPPLA